MKATLPFLYTRFAHFNATIFGNRLPPVEIQLSRATSFLGACTYRRKRGLLGVTKKYDFRIRISTASDMSEAELEDVLIHEMIHYYIGVEGIKDTGTHGAVFRKWADDINRRHGLRQQLIPYFISSHPGCTEEDMAELAVITKQLNFHLEQVQDFTPTPMTVASEIYYTGLHPYTLQPVATARTPQQKEAQRKYFFWYKPEYADDIRRSLMRLHRSDLISTLVYNAPRRAPNKDNKKRNNK